MSEEEHCPHCPARDHGIHTSSCPWYFSCPSCQWSMEWRTDDPIRTCRNEHSAMEAFRTAAIAQYEEEQRLKLAATTREDAWSRGQRWCELCNVSDAHPRHVAATKNYPHETIGASLVEEESSVAMEGEEIAPKLSVGFADGDSVMVRYTVEVLMDVSWIYDDNVPGGGVTARDIRETLRESLGTHNYDVVGEIAGPNVSNIVKLEIAGLDYQD